MKIISRLTVVSGAIGFTLAGVYATPASAQATRTWVSGVGDDLNPCSRTAPCKTFAGAISKTAAGGEINCLDPGAFGAVTINKALSIICQYSEAGVLATLGSNGITINAGANDAVYLSGLDVNGAGTGLTGIRFLAGASLVIENSIIRGFGAANGLGVSFKPSGASVLSIIDTTITTNGSGATGAGVLIQPTGTGSARVALRGVRAQGNSNLGISLNSTGETSGLLLATMENSEVTGNGSGISLISPAGGAVQTRLLMQGSNISNNPGIGITANGAQVQLRVGNSTISFNGTGLSSLNSAQIFSYGDNRLGMNILADGAFVVPSIPKS